MSDIATEMKRRQQLADGRESDPFLANTWQGSTTQPDIDSHQFPFEEGCGGKGCDHFGPDCRCCGDCVECNE